MSGRDRQTDRQTNRQIYRQIDRQTDRHIDRQTLNEWERDREMIVYGEKQ